MIKRFIFKRLTTEIKQPEIDIILGPRQVGKTTLLNQLKEFVEKLSRVSL